MRQSARRLIRTVSAFVISAELYCLSVGVAAPVPPLPCHRRNLSFACTSLGTRVCQGIKKIVAKGWDHTGKKCLIFPHGDEIGGKESGIKRGPSQQETLQAHFLPFNAGNCPRLRLRCCSFHSRTNTDASHTTAKVRLPPLETKLLVSQPSNTSHGDSETRKEKIRFPLTKNACLIPFFRFWRWYLSTGYRVATSTTTS